MCAFGPSGFGSGNPSDPFLLAGHSDSRLRIAAATSLVMVSERFVSK
jgi:hypothetical protein